MDIYALGDTAIGAEYQVAEAARPRSFWESAIELYGAHRSSEQAQELALAQANAGYRPAPTPPVSPTPTPTTTQVAGVSGGVIVLALVAFLLLR